MKISTAAIRYLSLLVMMTFAISSCEEDATPDRDTDKTFVPFGKLKSSKSEKYGKEQNKDKKSKTNKFEKESKTEKKSKKSKGNGYTDDFGDDIYNDDYIFTDEYWVDRCFFGSHLNNAMDDDWDDDTAYGFTDLDGAAVCVENFAENTYLDIDSEDALDCSESLEKTAWKAYPSCFELHYYTPYVCEELFRQFDEVYQCVYDVLWGPVCYLGEDESEFLQGCVTSFANTFDLDAAEFLDCSLDFYGVFDEICYSAEDSPAACDTFQECEAVYWSGESCTWNSDINLNDVTNIVEEALGIENFLDTIYDGSVDIVEVLQILNEYNNWPNATEWSEFVECITWELSWSIDDVCEWDFYEEEFGGCVDHFVDSFEWLDANEVLTCAVKIWDVVDDLCYNDDANMDVCGAFSQCGDTLVMIDDCMSYVPALGLSDLGEGFGDILPAIHNGTVGYGDAYNTFIAYNGTWSEADGWEDFVACLPEMNYYDDFYY